MRQDGPGQGRALRLGLAGLIAPWLSYPATLVAGGILAALVLTALRERDRPRWLVPLTVAWTVSILAVTRITQI